MNNYRKIASHIEVITREIELTYNKGVEEGYVEGYNQGYKKGNEDGNIANGTHEEKIKEAYENGLNDAWNAARKITLTTYDGGIITTKIHDIFNTSPYEVIRAFEAKEVIEKLKEENAHEAEWLIDYQKHGCRCSHCGFFQKRATKYCGDCGYIMKNAKGDENEAGKPRAD